MKKLIHDAFHKQTARVTCSATGKLRYDNRASAKRASKKLGRLCNNKLRPYPCPSCSGFHLYSMTSCEQAGLLTFSERGKAWRAAVSISRSISRPVKPYKCQKCGEFHLADGQDTMLENHL